MRTEWQNNKLGEVCSLLNRGISPRYLEKGGVCVLNQKCIRDHKVNYEPSKRHDIHAKKVKSDRLIQVGDVLVNSTGTGTLGRVAQIRESPTEPTTVDSHITIVRPISGKFYDEFFGYMLLVIEDAIKEAGEGCGGQTELARSTLSEKFTVHYPKLLSEQQRIVSILDKAFEAIAIAKANAEKNMQNARALFDNHLQAIFIQRAEGWVEKPFYKIIESNVIGIVKNTSEQGEGKTWPYVKMNNITPTNSFDFSRFTRVDATDNEVAKFSLRSGDFLFNTRNSYELVGKSCIYESNSEDVVLFNNNIMRVRFINEVDPKFILLALSSKAIVEELNSLKSGTTNVSAIYFKDLKSLIFPVPPIATQRKITARLNVLSKEIHRLESLYQRKLAALDELKKSLLHKAFSGNL